MRRILFILGGIVLLGLLAIGVFFFYPQDSVKGQKADIEISAAALYESYSADEAKGNAAYIDKVIEVSGTVEEILTDEQDATVFVLRAPDAMGGVLCTLDAGQEGKAKEVSVGDVVTLKGQCTGMLMDVVLNKCVLQK